MALLCFVVDLSRLQGAVLGSIQQCLLRLANLAVLRSHRSARKANESIGLCAIKMDPEAKAYQLDVICEPKTPFSYRDFHNAVINGLSVATTLTSQEGNGQVSSLSSLLPCQWLPETPNKRIIMLTNCFCEITSSFRQTIMDAASRCIMVDFIELDLSDRTNDQCLYPQPKLTGEFQVNVTEFENCTFQRVPWNSASISRLVKEWLQELGADDERSLEAVLSFQSPLVGSSSKVFCTVYPSVLKLRDVIEPCQACRCHGLPIGSGTQCNSLLCPVTGSYLDDQDIATSCLRLGEATILQMPSLSASPDAGSVVFLSVIGSVYLALLSESVLFGMPHVVISSSEADLEPDLRNNDHVFTALCQELHSKDAGLLCKSNTDIETGRESSFACFYILLPAQNGSFSAKRVATSEEVLPLPPAMRTITTVPEQVRELVRSSLFKMEPQSYDPLQHERGCDSKLRSLLNKSMEFRTTTTAPEANRADRQFVSASTVLNMAQGNEMKQPLGRLRKNLHSVIPRQQSTTTHKRSLPFSDSQPVRGRSRTTAQS